jgi:hypothetical protein
MQKYEYKTILLEFKGLGLFKSRKISPNLEDVLNREGRDGWRLNKVVLPSKDLGESENVIIIFEREIA